MPLSSMDGLVIIINNNFSFKLERASGLYYSPEARFYLTII